MTSFLVPDFTVIATSAVSINIYLTSDKGNDSTVTCSALAGTLASSIATCPCPGSGKVSLTDIRAVW